MRKILLIGLLCAGAAAAQIVSMSVGAPSFFGVGLNDPPASAGIYVGVRSNHNYGAVICAAGTPDTVQFNRDGGSYTGCVPMTGSAQPLSYPAGTLSAASWTASTATYTDTAHGLTGGALVTIAGASPSGYSVTGCSVLVVDADHFSCAVASNPGAWTSGGTVTAADGITIAWPATTGHSAGDSWTVAVNGLVNPPGFMQRGPGAVVRNTQTKAQEIVSVQDFGALGVGAAFDDSAFIQKAVNFACSLTNTNGVLGALLVFPPSPVYYNVDPNAVTLCSNLEIEGYKAKIHLHGALSGALAAIFTLPYTVDGSIHGFTFEGESLPGTWAIVMAGGGVSSAGGLNEHIWDNHFNNFGTSGINDVTANLFGTWTGDANPHTYRAQITATGTSDTFEWNLDGGAWTTGVSITGGNCAFSGGTGWQALSNGTQICWQHATGHAVGQQWIVPIYLSAIEDAMIDGGAIRVLADSAKMVVDVNKSSGVGTFFLSTAPTDSLNLLNNYCQDTNGRCVDLTGEAGAAQIGVGHNNSIGSAGSVRTVGPGTYAVEINEFEGTQTIENTNASPFEYLGDATGGPIVWSLSNTSAIKTFGTFCYYFDPSANGPLYSYSVADKCIPASPASGGQWAIANGNASSTNRWMFTTNYTYMGQLYSNPSDPGIVTYPPNITALPALTTNGLVTVGGGIGTLSSEAQVTTAQGGTSNSFGTFGDLANAVANNWNWGAIGATPTTNGGSGGSYSNLAALAAGIGAAGGGASFSVTVLTGCTVTGGVPSGCTNTTLTFANGFLQ